MLQRKFLLSTQQISKDISYFTIGFATLSVQGHVEDAVCAGPGTLVTVGSLYGILTAAHVLGNLPTKGQVGLVTHADDPSRFQKQIIMMEHTDSVIMRGKAFDQKGPDLGFLRLPQQSIGWIALDVLDQVDALDRERTLIERVTEQVTEQLRQEHSDSDVCKVLGESHPHCIEAKACDHRNAKGASEAYLRLVRGISRHYEAVERRANSEERASPSGADSPRGYPQGKICWRIVGCMRPELGEFIQ